MKRGSSAPKLHHYVPKSYLGRFVDAWGFLHVFDRETRTFRRQRPKEVMRINSYYRQEWAPPGVDPNILETSLGEWLEREAKGALDRLIHTPEKLNDDDSAVLLTYIEMQRIRVPRQAEAAKHLARTTLLSMMPPDAAETIRSGQLSLTIKDSARFDFMRMIAGHLSPWFGSMEWEVFTAGDGASFITTDSPVSFYNPEIPPPAEAGIGLAGTLVLFPLSSKHVLVMRHPEGVDGTTVSPIHRLAKPEHRDGQLLIVYGAVWDKELADHFNWRLLQLSHRLVVGESIEVLHRCVEEAP